MSPEDIQIQAPLRQFLIQMLASFQAAGAAPKVRFSLYDSGNTYTLSVALIGVMNPMMVDETGESEKIPTNVDA